MRTIIHDLNDEEVRNFKFGEDDFVVSALECEYSCVGCFSCWVRKPKSCAIKDGYSNMADFISKSDELVLISKCRYGCYSSKTKRVLERCIGYVLPYFTIREGRIHHKSRYDKKIKFNAYFYGDITDDDKKCLERLVKANSINLNAKDYSVNYSKNLKGVSECIH